MARPARKEDGKVPESAPGVGDNSEAREAALIRHMHVLRLARADTDAAKQVVKTRQKVETALRNAANSDGFMLKIIDEALKKEGQTRVDQQREENDRRFIFSALGLPVAQDGADLVTEAQRDERFWGQHGYSSGLKGLPAEAPPGMPGEFVQTWMRRHAAGADRLGWAQAEQQGASPERSPGADVCSMVPADEDAG
jgi:hypothetical protein